MHDLLRSLRAEQPREGTEVLEGEGVDERHLAWAGELDRAQARAVAVQAVPLDVEAEGGLPIETPDEGLELLGMIDEGCVHGRGMSRTKRRMREAELERAMRGTRTPEHRSAGAVHESWVQVRRRALRQAKEAGRHGAREGSGVGRGVEVIGVFFGAGSRGLGGASDGGMHRGRSIAGAAPDAGG